MEGGMKVKTKKKMLLFLVLCLLLPSYLTTPNAQAQEYSPTNSQVVNLINNPSFEERLTLDGKIPGWTIWLPAGDPVAAITTGAAKEGQFAAHISASAPLSVGALNQKVSVEEEKAYTLSYWMKTNGIDNAGNAYIRVQFLNASGTQAGTTLIVGNKAGSEEWKHISQTFTTPAGTTKLALEPILYRAQGEVWFDDLLLYDVATNPSAGFTSFHATVQNTGVVKLEWIPLVTSDDSVIFKVYRSETSGFSPDMSLLIGDTSKNFYYDQSIRSNTHYYYKVVMESSRGGEQAVSHELSANIPPELPAVPPVNTFKAIDTINNNIGLYWSLSNNQRAVSVKIFAADDPITEQNKTEAALIEQLVFAESSQYTIDKLSSPQLIKRYYAISVVDGNGMESSLTSAAVYSFLPKIDENSPQPRHPYLFANQAAIDAVLQNMNQYPWMKLTRNMIISNAEDAITRYGIMTEPLSKNNSGHSQMADAARLLSFAYVLTEDERYAEAAKHILLLYVDYYRINDYVYNQNKDDGYLVVPLAWAYDFIYNSSSLSAAEKEEIELGYFREVVKRIRILSRGRMNNQGMTNWAIGFVGFLLRDQVLLNEAFEREDYGLKYNWLNGIHDDSYWWEQSVGYHEERMNYSTLLAEAAYYGNYDLYGYQIKGTRDTSYQGSDAPRAVDGRIVEVEDKSIKEMLDFPFYFMFPDLTRPIFADTDPSILSPRYWYEMAYSHYGDDKYGWLLAQTLGADRSSGGINDYYSLFAAQPVLPEDTSFSIGNGFFNKKGYNKLGSSIFLESGAAILRSEGDYLNSTNLAMQWSRFGSFGHSHGDKLGIVLYGLGEEILADPGRYTYGTAGHKEFAKHTVAHNTLVVDEKSQYPYTDSNNEWKTDDPGRSSGGYASAISVGPVLKLIQAGNDNVYADFGVTLNRTVAEIDDYVIDVFKADSETAHSYDYPLTIKGELEQSSVELAALDQEVTLGSGIGYKFIKNLSKGMTSDVWTTNWNLGDGRKFRTTMLGVEETEVIKAAGLSKNGDYQNQMLIARRDQTESTIYLNVLEPYREGDTQRIVTSLPVQQPVGVTDEAYAVLVASPSTDVTDIFITGMASGMKQSGSLITDGETAFRRELNGLESVLAVVNGQFVEGTNVSVELTASSTAQMTRMNEQAWRFDYDGEQAATAKIGGIPSDSVVYELALKDVNELTPVAFSILDGKFQFTANPGKIYVLGGEQSIASLPLPITVPMGVPIEGLPPISGQVTVIEEALNGYIYEAEDFDYETGGRVTIAFKGGSHTTNHPLGDAFYGWDNKGHTLEWKIAVPESGNYRVMVRYATLVYNSVRKFNIDDGEAYLFHFPTTPGWNDRRNGLLQDIEGNDLLFHLEQGTHTIRMENVGGALNLDYFLLELINEDITLESVSQMLEMLITEGDVKKPLTNQLQNSLQQAKHHWENGKQKQAIKSLEDCLKHINRQANQDKIDVDAKNELAAVVQALIASWQEA